RAVRPGLGRQPNGGAVMARNLERRITYLAGVVLLLAAVLFAALRSEGFGLTLAQDHALTSADGSSLEERFEWFGAADATWEDRCSGCHATLDYIPALFAADGGREYLIDVMLFGAQGEARIYGQLVSLRHRPFAGTFDDEQMTGLLNLMMVAWGNEEALPEATELYTAAEVAAARQRDIPQDDVLRGRPEYGQ